MKKYYEDVTGRQTQYATSFMVIQEGGSIIYLRPVELPATGWVSLKDRKPTVEDADEKEAVVFRSDRTVWIGRFDNIHADATHFHPIAKFAHDKLPPFGEWLRTVKKIDPQDRITAQEAEELHAEYLQEKEKE